MKLTLKRILTLVLGLTALALVSWPVGIFSIQTEEGRWGFPLLCSFLTVKIRYVHSVSITLVEDTYCVSVFGIWVVKEKWQDFIAGQPIDFDYTENGFYVKTTRRFLGNEWYYGFIPFNKVLVFVDNRPVITNIKKEGLMILRVRFVPLSFLLFSNI